MFLLSTAMASKTPKMSVVEQCEPFSAHPEDALHFSDLISPASRWLGMSASAGMISGIAGNEHMSMYPLVDFSYDM